MNDTTLANNSVKLGETLKHAWQQLQGSKWLIWKPMLGFGITSIAFGVLLGLFVILPMVFFSPEIINTLHAAKGSLSYELVRKFIGILIFSPFLAGIIFVTIKRMRTEEVDLAASFRYVNFRSYLIFLKMILLSSIIVITQTIAAASFGGIAGGIAAVSGYTLDSNIFFALVKTSAFLAAMLISTFAFFAVPLLIDKNLSVITALRCSVMVARKYFLETLALVFITSALLYGILLGGGIIITALALSKVINLFGLIIYSLTLIYGISLIWFIPLYFLIKASFYVQLTNTPKVQALLSE